MEKQQDNTPYTYLYRVQGGNLSKPTILVDNTFHVKNFNEHLFVSKTEQHHIYYIGKRTIQYIQKYIMGDIFLPYHKNWKEHHIAKQICEKLEKEPEFQNPLQFYQLTIPTCLYDWIEENSLSSLNKHEHPLRYYLPKKVDELRLGGGYHISKIWLRVLLDATFSLTYRTVTKNDLYTFLKETEKSSSHHIADFGLLLQEIQPKQLSISNASTYQKNIENDIIELVKWQAYLEQSRFGQNPIKEMERFLSNVEEIKPYIKQKVL